MTTIVEAAPLEYIRLHITPFDENLFERLIPESLRRVSKNPSFHELQTFPERNYGYVELPRIDAEKLKKKFNGSLLKGQKVSIEEARPMPKRKSDAIEAEKAERKKARRDAKSKAQGSVIDGHQLDEGRHVKRGWTEDKSQRKKSRSENKEKSEKTGEQRALFKTVVPPNLADAVVKNDAKGKKSGKTKKNATVVEEFSKSKKSFVTSKAGSSTGEVVGFEEGKGWVDVDGNVVEAVKSQRRNADLPGQRLGARSSLTANTSAEVRSTVESSESGLGATKQLTTPAPAKFDTSEDDTSDVDDDDSSSSENEENEPDIIPASMEVNDQSGIDEADSPASVEDATSPSSTQGTEPELVSASTVSDTKEVHPLEALYKRKNEGDNKLQLAPLETSFSFFSNPKQNGNDGASDEDGTMRPITPYTSQDLDYSRRSAAPTPDTAAIGGRFGFPFGGHESDEDEETPDAVAGQIDADEDTASTSNVKGEQSAFRKFFYEKRGETDRAWKKKRRDAKKLQRQRENRRLSRRIV